MLAEQFESAPSTDLSLDWYDNSAIEYEGEDAFPVGGYRRIVEYLADGLDVRTGQLVTSVAYDARRRDRDDDERTCSRARTRSSPCRSAC